MPVDWEKDIGDNVLAGAVELPLLPGIAIMDVGSSKRASGPS